MQYFNKGLILFIPVLTLAPASGQEALDIFGYFQLNVSYIKDRTTLSNKESGFQSESVSERKSYMVQQANIFLRKELNVKWAAWLNLEFTNSFSSDEGWGTVNLEEAWLRYRHSGKFNLKAGLLIPRFNNLNEVKNRMPYLPYILRPLVYESSLAEVLRQDDYVPERAHLQMYGELPLNNWWAFDYAVYVGNAEDDFHNSDPGQQIQTGVDTTLIFLVGSRIGLKTSTFKAGVSIAFDKDNLARHGLGSVRRVRIGSDLSFTVSRISFEGEVIFVKHEEVENANLDKSFFYGTVGYDITDRIFGYLTYSRMQDNLDPTIENGLIGISPGIAYRLLESVLFKVQYVKILNDGSVPVSESSPVPLDLEFNIDTIALGASIIL